MSQSIKHILVPVDGSNAGLTGVKLAESLAKATGAKLTFIHVLDATMRELLRVEGGRDGSLVGVTDDELESLVQKQVVDPYFETAKSALNYEGVSVELQSATGSPAEEICAFASENGVDLIVMGARGASSFKALMLGGVAAQVVQHAPCSVTIAR